MTDHRSQVTSRQKINQRNFSRYVRMYVLIIRLNISLYPTNCLFISNEINLIAVRFFNLKQKKNFNQNLTIVKNFDKLKDYFQARLQNFNILQCLMLHSKNLRQ